MYLAIIFSNQIIPLRNLRVYVYYTTFKHYVKTIILLLISVTTRNYSKLINITKLNLLFYQLIKNNEIFVQTVY